MLCFVSCKSAIVNICWSKVVTCFCQTSNGQVPAVLCFLRKFRLRRCYAKHGVGLGVVGWWGCDVNAPCTCTHGQCYAAHGVEVGWWGCDVNVSCTCTHGRASKATLQVNTGAIDGWWTRTRAKDSIPPSLHTLLGNGKVNPKIFQCVQRYEWRWEHPVLVQISWQKRDNRPTKWASAPDAEKKAVLWWRFLVRRVVIVKL